MTMRPVLGVLLLLWGCASSSPSTQRANPKAGPAFIENDWERALREAREKQRPLFVETWAPWCQSCRSMRSTVLTSPALEELEGRFVWLAIDTDAPANEAFLQRYPVDTWPTVLILEPEQGAVLVRSLGGVSVPQLLGLLAQGEQAFQRGRAGGEELARADGLALTGHHAEAAAAYQQAVVHWTPEDSRRASAVVSWLKSLLAMGDTVSCMRVAAQELGRLPRVDDRTRVLYVGMGCALDAKTDEARALREQLAQEAARAREAPEGTLTPALRSSLYEVGCEVHEASGDEASMRELAETWWRFLEEQATRARSAEERAALDSHRVMAVALLARPEAALSRLERSERELPEDYNPPARLATLHLMAGQHERALAASERALSLAKGASRGTVLAGQARILSASGNRAQAEALLTQALNELEQASVPKNHLQRQVLERVLSQLRAEGDPPSP
ncbi:co-chaperone YbbN [Myxococcus sp. CA040A]|uniref:thioredoxin family protein n=1 Tax=Myxococcus sp. CA040A TaxID=2741738 RepID=UPI00157B00F5|nr:thioredoxin family protein [Myxococcus sp. CA040A]NTX00141.1 thioredoxin family protein [Myxococcus sp. CA040A]